MKSFAAAFLVIIAGAAAFPQYDDGFAADRGEERLVGGAITSVIEQASQRIKDAGLDPVVIDNAEFEYVVLPMVAEFSAFVDSLNFYGLSDIVVHDIDYSVLRNRLRFDVSLREISLSVGNSALRVVLFESNADSSFNGSVSVKQIRISGEVRINIGLISGISVRSLSIRFTLGGIESAVNLNVFGLDLSRIVNTVLNNTIPEFITKRENDINDLIERIAWEIIGRVL